MSHNLEALKRQFLEYVEIEKGRSLSTVMNYEHYLSRFIDFSGAKNVEDITDSGIREYRLWLNRQEARTLRTGIKETLKRRTQNYYLIALRSFLKYLARQGIKAVPPERIELAKVPERSLDLISNEDLEALMKAPGTSTLKGLRDTALLELLFSTGLRVSELCGLHRDINLSRDEFPVRGKGEKVRVVFLSDAAKRSVRLYLDARKDMDDALFVQLPVHERRKNSNGAKNGVKSGAKTQKSSVKSRNSGSMRLTPRSVERIIKFYAIKAGISKKVTPHVIRHSFATDLLRNGADIRSVQMLLGHANIGTTQIYTHITDSELRNVHKKFHSKSRENNSK